MLTESRHIFGRRPKPRAGHYIDLTETRNYARKVSGTQGSLDKTTSTKLITNTIFQTEFANFN